MQLLRSSLVVSAAALVLMGAGCSTNSTTTVTTNTNNANANVAGTNPANSNTSNVNDTPTTTDDAAGGTSLSGSADANVNDTPTVDEGATEIDATVNETKTFDVVSSQFAFTPETLTVNQGDTVVLNLTTSDVPHGFSLPTFGVNETITPGKTKTVEFVADQAGSFTFTCSVACGAGHSSMRGTLVVN